MKKIIILFLIPLTACVNETTNTNTKYISGQILTKGAANPVEGMKVTLGTYGTIASSGQTFAETTTNEEGQYTLEFSQSQASGHVFINHYPKYDITKVTDDNGVEVSSQVGAFQNTTRNFDVRPVVFASVTISNTSGKFYRIEGVLQHPPHKATFFKLEEGQSSSFLIPVWGDDQDSFRLLCTKYDEYGNGTKYEEIIETNIPYGETQKFKITL